MSSSNTFLSVPYPNTTSNTRPSLLRSLSSHSSVSSIAKKNKPRLYLALYARGTGTGSCSSSSSYNTSLTCPSYHWALIIGPKSSSRLDPGTCLQVVHSNDRSWYEEVDLSRQTSIQAQSLLLRVTLAKVRDEDTVKAVLQGIASKNVHENGNDKAHSNVSSATSLLSSSASNRSNPHHGRASSRADTGIENETLPHNNCLAWVRNAFEVLFGDDLPSFPHPSARMLKSYMTARDWPELEECARKYAKKKRNQGRFHNVGMGLNRGGGEGDGHGGYRNWEDDEIATWNFWERRETTP